MANVTKVLIVDDEYAIADAIHVWHGDIADNEIGLQALCDLDSLGAGIDGRRIEASLVEMIASVSLNQLIGRKAAA